MTFPRPQPRLLKIPLLNQSELGGELKADSLQGWSIAPSRSHRGVRATLPKRLPGEGAGAPTELLTHCESFGNGAPSRQVPANFEFFHSPLAGFVPS